MFILIGWFLYKMRAGLVLRSFGESPSVAHSVGFPVIGVRYGATLFGGAMAGVAGGYYSIVYLHVWQEQLTSGRGWIALALVVCDVAAGASADRRALVRRAEDCRAKAATHSTQNFDRRNSSGWIGFETQHRPGESTMQKHG